MLIRYLSHVRLNAEDDSLYMLNANNKYTKENVHGQCSGIYLVKFECMLHENIIILLKHVYNCERDMRKTQAQDLYPSRTKKRLIFLGQKIFFLSGKMSISARILIYQNE